jgi:GH24 family phage-related lysozyme (muramidase)
MLSKFLNFIFSLLKREQNSEKAVVEEPKKERTYLDYDWTPVIEFETGGKSYYEKCLKKMTWPKGASGITMGIGADLGYMNQDEFDKHFSSFFTDEERSRLKSVIGLKGENAREVLSKVKDIELSWENASKAFVSWTLPKFWKLTNALWPKTNELCEKAQIALVSIAFNRGTSTKGPSRVEMVNIKDLVVNKDYKGIAKEIRSMKRLWEGKGLDGLLKRREKEANMVESCA